VSVSQLVRHRGGSLDLSGSWLLALARVFPGRLFKTRMHSPPLVSVVIPCYNTQRWVREAVQSCLDQTYSPIEVIVVDDGSTDRSVDVLTHFGDRITVIRIDHGGGSRARNIGFYASQGEFIQFLDADDYLLPEKIERQMTCMRSGAIEAVYSDWRHLNHHADGGATFEPVRIAGPQDDMLEALLDNRWVAPCALLFSRSIVEQVGGWDESLEAGQDRDFFTRVAFQTDRIDYVPGCYAIYRKYGNVTVSTRDPVAWKRSTRRVLDKADRLLQERGNASNRYQQALASSYFTLARMSYETDRAAYRDLVNRALALHPDPAIHEPVWMRYSARLLGFERTERLAIAKRTVVRRILGGRRTSA
jgi:glycosyltransferase involved in cell wall biosynthesis